MASTNESFAIAIQKVWTRGQLTLILAHLKDELLVWPARWRRRGVGGGVPSVLRFLIKSSFLWCSHQIHFQFATWIHCIILINICAWFQDDIWKMRPKKKLWFLIKSCFLWSYHQIHFKFAALFHCIILINMWVFKSWYILIFFCFMVFLSLFLLRKM